MQRPDFGLRISIMVLLLVVASMASGQENSQAQSSARAVPADAAQATTTPDHKSNINFKDGRLSVDVQGRTLGLLANDISDRTGVMVIPDDSAAQQSVSVSFQGLALDEALRRIFKNNDAFYYYESDKHGSAALKVVWVYAKGKGRGLQPVPPEKWASTKEMERMLTDQDPQVRGRAIETLVERKGQQALDAVLNSLGDTDGQVRTRALYGAEKAGVQIPEGVLTNLLASDASADVRFLALQALAASPNVRSAAEAALNDPSEPVRQQATEILNRMDSNNTPARTETPQSQPAPN